MSDSLTLEDIDNLIANFDVSKSSEIYLFLTSLRSFYHSDSDFKNIGSIKTNELINLIWKYSKNNLEDNNVFIQNKKKHFSYLKTTINNKCRDLFWNNKNIKRIGIGRLNTFSILKETKYEESKKLKSEVKILQNMLNDVAPEVITSLNEASEFERLNEIREGAAKAPENIISDNKITSFARSIEKHCLKNVSLTQNEIDNTSHVIEIHEDVIKFYEEIEKINQQILNLDSKIQSGELSEMQGNIELSKVLDRKIILQKNVDEIIKKINLVNTDNDLFLKNNIENLNNVLTDFKNQNKVNVVDVEKNLLSALNASIDFEKAEKLDKENYVDIKNDFFELKRRAKEIISDFKDLHPKIEVLLEKNKNNNKLDNDETKNLNNLNQKLNTLQIECTEILNKLRIIYDKSEGPIREASKLIISALEKFILEKDRKKEIIVEVKKMFDYAENLKTEEKKLAVFSKLVLSKIASSKPSELNNLKSEYKQIQSEIEKFKNDIDVSKKELSNLKNENNNQFSSIKNNQDIKVEGDGIDNSLSDNINFQLVINAKEQSLKLAEKLDGLNNKALEITNKIQAGIISEIEGEHLLKIINEDRVKVELLVKKLSDTLDDIKTGGDPVLDNAMQKIKGFIKDWSYKKGISDVNILEGMIEESLNALDEFEKSLNDEKHDEVVFENREQLEKEFKVLKDSSKEILTKFKAIHPKLKEYILKKKNKIITNSENDIFINLQSDFESLQSYGSKILEDLRNIEKQSEGTIKEACRLIISSLDRFIKSDKKDDEVLMFIDKNKKFADQLRANDSAFSNFSNKMLNKIISQKPNELKNIQEEYEKIKNEVNNIKNAIEEKKNEKEKLITNLQIESKLNMKGNYNSIISANNETQELFEKLDKLNQKALKVHNNIIEGKISEQEGKIQLDIIYQEKLNLDLIAQKINETLKNIEEGKDSNIDIAIDKFKCILKNFLHDKEITNLSDIENIIEKGLNAFNNIEDKLESDIKDNTVFENKEKIENEFNDLRDKAKTLLLQFKSIHPKIKYISEKQKTKEGLNEDEKITLKSFQEELINLQKDGSKILTSLIQIESVAEGPIKESAKLIISALERFIDSKRAKDEILKFVKKNQKFADQIIESNETLLAFSNQLINSFKEDDYNTLPIQDKILFAKANTHKLALQLDLLLSDSKKYNGELVESTNDDLEQDSNNVENLNELRLSIDMLKTKGDKVYETLLNKLSIENKNIDSNSTDESTINMILLLKYDTEQLSETLKTIQTKYIDVKNKLENKKISLQDAENELKLLEEKQESLKIKAKALNYQIIETENIINDRDSEKLTKATDLIKDSLNKIMKEKSFSENDLVNAVNKGVRAIEDFRKGEDKLNEYVNSEDSAENDLKNKFVILKNQAKGLINQLKVNDAEISKIDKLDKSEEEAMVFDRLSDERQELENKGKVLIKEMEAIFKISKGSLKEAAMLIISSLKRFIKDIIIINNDESLLKEDDKVIVLNMEKGEKSLDEVIDEIKKRKSLEKVEVVDSDNIKTLDHNEIEKSKNNLESLNSNLREIVTYLAGIDAKYFPYNLDISEEDKDILKKIDSSERTFEKQAEIISKEISELLSKIGIERSKKEPVVSEGLSLLKKGLNNIQNENIWDAIVNINSAVNAFEKTSENINPDEKKQDEPKSFFIPPSKQSAIGAMTLIMDKFYIDKFPVTFSNFRKFVEVTGYKTYAEKLGYGWVIDKTGWISVKDGVKVVSFFQNASIRKVQGACWYSPEGKKKHIIDIVDSMHHPVVQITYKDALAFAKWKDKRLPTVQEWLFAAFGNDNKQYTWGDDLSIDKCNNQLSPFLNTSPVDTFSPNSFGVYDMLGNVWEWCEGVTPNEKMLLGGCWNLDLKKIGRNFQQKASPLEFSNTIGFRCIKDL